MYTFIRINKKTPKEFRNILECDKIPGLPVRTGAWHGGFRGHPVGAEIDNGWGWDYTFFKLHM